MDIIEGKVTQQIQSSVIMEKNRHRKTENKRHIAKNSEWKRSENSAHMRSLEKIYRWTRFTSDEILFFLKKKKEKENRIKLYNTHLYTLHTFSILIVHACTVYVLVYVCLIF